MPFFGRSSPFIEVGKFPREAEKFDAYIIKQIGVETGCRSYGHLEKVWRIQMFSPEIESSLGISFSDSCRCRCPAGVGIGEAFPESKMLSDIRSLGDDLVLHLANEQAESVATP